MLSLFFFYMLPLCHPSCWCRCKAPTESFLKSFPMQQCNRQQVHEHSQVAAVSLPIRFLSLPTLSCLANEWGCSPGWEKFGKFKTLVELVTKAHKRQQNWRSSLDGGGAADKLTYEDITQTVHTSRSYNRSWWLIQTDTQHQVGRRVSVIFPNTGGSFIWWSPDTNWSV